MSRQFKRTSEIILAVVLMYHRGRKVQEYSRRFPRLATNCFLPDTRFVMAFT
jgi:hypothetical protein